MKSRLTILAVLLVKTLAAQDTLRTYDFPELDSLWQAEERPALVLLTTDWCRYCKRMERSTLQDAAVIELLNEKYYFVPFNGESRDSVTFLGRTFHYLPTGPNTGEHELARLLGQDETGRLSYPTLVVLSARRQILGRYGGYLSARELLRSLQ